MTLENGYLLRERYRILNILGQGGMGAVYRAVDENLDVIVAVKENVYCSEDYTRQFQREARVLAALRHPNLPRVFDYFVVDQQAQYLVMDYIEGEDLRQWIAREDVLPEVEVLQIGIAICDALIYLHNQSPGITHRDIKPGNIKITPNGEIVLVDFGLVKISGQKEKTTTAARAMTPGYSPPEQYGDAPTDHRSDLFSLGATLYAALGGFLPEDSLARATGKLKLTPLHHYNPRISQQTIKIVEKALALHFEDRWQSAGALRKAFLEALHSLPADQKPSRRLASSVMNSQDPNDPDRSIWVRESDTLTTPQQNRRDYGWIIYGLAILLLLVVLGILLLRSDEIAGFFWGTATQEATVTLTPAQTQLTKTPEQTTEQPIVNMINTPRPPTTQAPAQDSPTPTPTSPGGGSGGIAFVSERSGQPQIWLVDVSTGDQVQLTDLSEGACQPDWSPDGKRIVFTSPCSRQRDTFPGSSLFVQGVAGGYLRQLPASLEGDFDPAWSPDGRWIAYTSLINGRRQLMKINLEYLNPIRLSDGSYDDSAPSWSPDGERLAFVRVRGVSQIWLMDPDGSDPVQFTFSGLIDNSNPA